MTEQQKASVFAVVLIVCLVVAILCTNFRRESFCINQGYDGHRLGLCYKLNEDNTIDYTPISTIRIIEKVKARNGKD